MNVVMEIVDVNSFKSIFSTIDSIIESVTFECYEDRVEINALDKSNTIFMSCKLYEDYFVKYNIKEPDRFSVDVSELKKCLKSCKNNLIVKFDESYCHLISESKKFKIFLLNDDFSTPKPKMGREYDYSTHVPVKEMKEMTKNIELFSRDVNIITSPDDISFCTQSHMGEFSCSYGASDGEMKETDNYYSIEKVKTCLGSDKVADSVLLQGCTDYPLFLTFENDGINVQYMIAQIIKE